MNRKEAIEVVKNNLPHSFTILREALETLIPELKESDDEKIRKALLNTFKHSHLNENPYMEGVSNESVISWLEKQGEQKNVKPKFKVGDWVTDKIVSIEPRQIAEIIKGGYRTTHGRLIGFPFENEMRLWTINDAKDGDVLQFGKITAIFKELLCNGNCRFHCSVYEEIFIVNPDDIYGYCATPATKEKRDFLFSKMKEAEYEWDTENKLLRKF